MYRSLILGQGWRWLVSRREVTDGGGVKYEAISHGLDW